MSSNIAYIDLNSDFVLGDRESEGHGDDLSESRADHFNQQCHVENSLTEVLNDKDRNLCEGNASGGRLFESAAKGVDADVRVEASVDEVGDISMKRKREITDLPGRDENLNKMLPTTSLHNGSMKVNVGEQTEEIRASSMFNIVTDLNQCFNSDGKTIKSGNEESSVSAPDFHSSDLVWGKVRSHPWWPGQIFDPYASSNKAKKHFKKSSYLIAYFGDQTFAWNEVSLIKPFQEHFLELEMQSNLERFNHAIDCALEEISRRVEFGLACHCLSSELYSDLKTQTIINAGIREEAIPREDGDKYFGAASFNPGKLVFYIKSVAQFSHGEVNRLEFEIARAQTMAFNRWKGYKELPEFGVIGGLFENEEELGKDEKKHRKLSGNVAVEIKGNKAELSGKGSEKNQDRTSGKRKYISGNSVYPSKKEGRLDLMDEKLFHRPNSEHEVHRNTYGGLILNISGQKDKRNDAVFDDQVKCRNDHLPVVPPEKNAKTNQMFRVGDSIQRVANRLNGPNPILVQREGISQNTVGKKRSTEKPNERSQSGKFVESDLHSADEVLSQLCWSATEPMKANNLLASMVSFLSDFRNYISIENSSSRKRKQEHYGKTRVKSSRFARSAKKIDLELMQTIPEESSALGSKKKIEEPVFIQSSVSPDSKVQVADSNIAFKVDQSPAALILNFTNFDSVPSKTKLNEIFSRCGTLVESETQVLKKNSHARVVFRCQSDAESAFSSAGKYSVFGESLVSYRLKYLSGPSMETCPNSAKRGEKGGDS